MFVHLNLSGQFAYSEGFYNYGMLVSQVVGTVINLFTLFIVWRYSTAEMANYKKHLIIYVVSKSSPFMTFWKEAGRPFLLVYRSTATVYRCVYGLFSVRFWISGLRGGYSVNPDLLPPSPGRHLPRPPAYPIRPGYFSSLRELSSSELHFPTISMNQGDISR